MEDLIFTLKTYISSWYGDFITDVVVPGYKKINKEGNVNWFNLNIVLPIMDFLISLLIKLDVSILKETIIKLEGTGVLVDMEGNVLTLDDYEKLKKIVENSIWGDDNEE